MLKNINNMTSSQEDPQPVHCMSWSEVGFSVMADDDDAIWAAYHHREALELGGNDSKVGRASAE